MTARFEPEQKTLRHRIEQQLPTEGLAALTQPPLAFKYGRKDTPQHCGISVVREAGIEPARHC
jgi:hypothetical protein